MDDETHVGLPILILLMNQLICFIENEAKYKLAWNEILYSFNIDLYN